LLIKKFRSTLDRYETIPAELQLNLKSFLLLLLTVTFTLCGQVLMKKGLIQTQAVTFRNIISSYTIIAGGLCYIGSFVVWLHVLKVLPLSIAYPAASISYIGVIIASSVFLNEPVNLFKVIGAALIIAGVFFISRAY